MAETAPQVAKTMEHIVSLCKRRGFVYPASEIYGGINGFWDYGPLGVILKNNLRDAWWQAMVLCPPLGPDGKPLQIVGLDSSIIQHPKTWVASGHVAGFNDPMVDCRETKQRYRADHLKCGEALVDKGGEQRSVGWFAVMEGDDEVVLWTRRAEKLAKKSGSGTVVPPTLVPYTTLSSEDQAKVTGPDTDTAGTLTEPRMFNLMFESHAGAIRDENSKVYLRPETAQGIFLNYKNVLDTTRVRVPFGVAQIGKAFRNEVTPRNFIFRSREFEQMEMEWFCRPDEASQWYRFWQQTRLDWWKSLGIASDKLRLRGHDADELSHYAKQGEGTSDIEYRYPFSEPNYGELEGVAHRTNFDLAAHQEHSRTKLEYFDQERNERFLPHVIEPAAGLTRGMLVLICEAFTPDATRPSGVFLKFHPRLAPIKAGIFPLVNKDGLPEVAEKLFGELRSRFPVEYDPKQTIGKRYARMDEAGTPFCFTIDGDTLKDQTVTVRHRDTQAQERIDIGKVASFLAEKLL